MKEVDPETFGGRREEQFDTFMFFPTLHLLEREVKPWFSVTFKIIISHIFSENFIEAPKSFRRYEDFIRPCQLFNSIGRIFLHFFLTKKLMTLAYNISY